MKTARFAGATFNMKLNREQWVDEVRTIRMSGWVNDSNWVFTRPLTRAVLTSLHDERNDRIADYSRLVTLARCVLNEQQTLRPKSSRLTVAGCHFPLAADDDKEIPRRGRMPLTLPTRRRLHETKLCCWRHR